MFHVLSSLQYYDTIGCLPPCHRPTYDVEMEYTIDDPAAKDDEDHDDPNSEVGGVRLIIYAPLGVLTRRSEYYVYDLGALAGDAGGMVGMLLGASLLGAYDLALDWAGAILGGGGGRRRTAAIDK